ncbi:Hypothetical protein FKW44_016869, partial [Caligus rogercresseyi]
MMGGDVVYASGITAKCHFSTWRPLRYRVSYALLPPFPFLLSLPVMTRGSSLSLSPVYT